MSLHLASAAAYLATAKFVEHIKKIENEAPTHDPLELQKELQKIIDELEKYENKPSDPNND